jgi:hypothetical protein
VSEEHEITLCTGELKVRKNNSFFQLCYDFSLSFIVSRMTTNLKNGKRCDVEGYLIPTHVEMRR